MTALPALVYLAKNKKLLKFFEICILMLHFWIQSPISIGCGISYSYCLHNPSTVVRNRDLSILRMQFCFKTKQNLNDKIFKAKEQDMECTSRKSKWSLWERINILLVINRKNVSSNYGSRRIWNSILTSFSSFQLQTC